MDPVDASDSFPGRRFTWGALAAGVAATYVLQVSAFTNLKLAAKAAGYVGGRRPDTGELLDLGVASLGPLDWLACGALVFTLVVLVIAEVRGRHLSGILRDALSETGNPWPLLALIGALAVRSYVDPGIPHAFDGKQHYAKLVAVTQILGDAEWPSWTWRWYGGFPLLRFYGPLLYVGAGVMGNLLGGAAAGLKLLLLLLHLASGWAVFSYVRTWCGSQRAAVVACVAYLLCFQRFHTLLALGRLPEAPLYLLFPLLLLAVERFVGGTSWRTGLAAGATLAAMVLTHPMMGALGGALAGCYALVRVIAAGVVTARPIATVSFAALTGGLGFALAAFWLLPALDEQPHVLLGQMYGGGMSGLLPGGFSASSMELSRLFAWGPPSRYGASLAYAGLSLFVLTTIGLIRHVRSQWARGLPLAALVLLVLVYLAGGYFQTRAVVFLAPLLAAGAGWAVVGIAEGKSPRSAGLAGLALLAILVDLLPLSVHAPFRPDLEPIERQLRAVAPMVTGSKVIVASKRRGDQVAVSQWTGWGDSGVHVLGGPFREGATSLYPWLMTVLHAVGEDLRDGGSLEPATVHALRLHGVGAVLVEDGNGLIDPAVAPGDGYRIESDPPGVFLDDAGPALYAPRCARTSPDLERRIQSMPPLTDLPEGAESPWPRTLADVVRIHGVETKGMRAERILLAPDSAPTGASSPRWKSAPVTFADATAEHAWIRFSVDVPDAGFLLLPYAQYPGVQVWLDDELQAPLRSLEGSPVVPVFAGHHRVELRGDTAPFSRRGAWISSIALLLLVLAAAVSRRWPRR